MSTSTQEEQKELTSNTYEFPAGFIWGTATASYQIEGAAHEDGRRPSIWDTFCATPGKVWNGDNGDVACDHYHRWRDDIGIMRQLNTNAYRFSIAWPRVLPQGTGPVNEKGLDFYDRLVDGLLEAGIKPFATLYHWDLPQILEDKGGWANRETAYAFAEYTEVVTKRLGDRVAGFITLNEPWCSAYLGYKSGYHAPGVQNDEAYARSVHHLLLAHSLAMPIIRRNAPGAQAGITLNLAPHHPASESEADREAAYRAGEIFNGMFLDPIFNGHYNPVYLSSLPVGVTPPVVAGDMELIKTPMDFLGINFYNRQVIEASKDSYAGKSVKPEGIYTTMDWEVYPDALYELLVMLNERYKAKSYYITENGASGEQEVAADGHVHDKLRLYYYQEHLHAALRAIQEGVPLAGYFAWSLMDNFEWAYGYSRRFGIVHVDYQTQKRTIKDSGHWYAGVAKSNHLPEERINYR
ncbi:MAG TPA: GH1 family beta-glucosidase [Chloroflexia bacterium]|nr:GH1 family beta-glucosidase [Chloroflexia bacterium]